MPIPVSAIWSDTRSFVRTQRHRDRALERELEGVREQIEDDLLPHVAIDVDRLALRRAVDDERQPCSFDGGAKRARELRGQGGEVDWLVGGLHAPGFDPREIEERVDELQQTQGIAVEELHGRRIDRRPDRGAEHVLDRREDQRQGRTEFVTDVAEERRLRAVDRGERLGSPLLRFVGCRVADGLRDAGRQEVVETIVRCALGTATGSARRRCTRTGRPLPSARWGARPRRATPPARRRARESPASRVLQLYPAATPGDRRIESMSAPMTSRVPGSRRRRVWPRRNAYRAGRAARTGCRSGSARAAPRLARRPARASSPAWPRPARGGDAADAPRSPAASSRRPRRRRRQPHPIRRGSGCR